MRNNALGGLAAAGLAVFVAAVACSPPNDSVAIGPGGASGGSNGGGASGTGGASGGGTSGASGGGASGGTSGETSSGSSGGGTSGTSGGASGGTTGGDPTTSVPGLRLRMDLLSAGEGSTGLRGLVPFSDGSVVGYGYERLSTGNIDAFVMKFAANGSITWTTHFGGGDSENLFGAAEGIGGAIVVVGQTNGHALLAKLDGAGGLQSASTVQVKLSNQPGGTQLLGPLHGIVASATGYHVIGDAVGSGVLVNLDGAGQPASASIASWDSTFDAIAVQGTKILVAGSGGGAALGVIATSTLQLERAASIRAGASSRFDGVAASDDAIVFVGRSNGGDGGIDRGWMLRASGTLQVQGSQLALGNDVADASAFLGVKRLATGDFFAVGSRGKGYQKSWVARFEGATLAGRAVTVDPGVEATLTGGAETPQALWAAGTRIESGRDQPVRVTLPLADFGVSTACEAAVQTDPIAITPVSATSQAPNAAELTPVMQVTAVAAAFSTGPADAELGPFCY